MYFFLCTTLRNLLHRTAVLGAFLMAFSASTYGNCVNSSTPSCGIYKACFAKYCPCHGSPDEYFENYGEKYCHRFMQELSFSPTGEKWRNSTLICLQEAIVPKLDLSDTPKCNCAQMRSFAFDSHVGCYTKAGASICELPIADVNLIRKAIDTGDVFSTEGWKQMKEIVAVCETAAPPDGRRTMWKAIASILSLK